MCFKSPVLLMTQILRPGAHLQRSPWIEMSCLAALPTGTTIVADSASSLGDESPSGAPSRVPCATSDGSYVDFEVVGEGLVIATGGSSTTSAGGGETAGAGTGAGRGGAGGGGDGGAAASGGGDSTAAGAAGGRKSSCGGGAAAGGCGICGGRPAIGADGAACAAASCPASLPPLFPPPSSTPSVTAPATSSSTMPAARYVTHSFLLLSALRCQLLPILRKFRECLSCVFATKSLFPKRARC